MTGSHDARDFVVELTMIYGESVQAWEERDPVYVVRAKGIRKGEGE